MIESLQIETSSVCNLWCIMCPVPLGKVKRNRAFMSFETFQWIIDTTPSLKSVGLNNWGEPLLNPYVIKMIKYASDKGIRTTFATNALFLDKIKSEKLINAGLNSIKFSIDGIENSYNKIRLRFEGKYGYDYIAYNIEYFLELNSKASNPVETEIVTTIWNDTENQFAKIQQAWEKKIGKIIAQPKLLFCGKRTLPCPEIFNNRLVVLSDGRVTVCCADYEGILELGKIPEQTLDDMLNGSRLHQLQEEHSRKVFLYPCSTCTEYDTKLGKKRFEYD